MIERKKIPYPTLYNNILVTVFEIIFILCPEEKHYFHFGLQGIKGIKYCIIPNEVPRTVTFGNTGPFLSFPKQFMPPFSFQFARSELNSLDGSLRNFVFKMKSETCKWPRGYKMTETRKSHRFSFFYFPNHEVTE